LSHNRERKHKINQLILVGSQQQRTNEGESLTIDEASRTSSRYEGLKGGNAPFPPSKCARTAAHRSPRESQMRPMAWDRSIVSKDHTGRLVVANHKVEARSTKSVDRRDNESCRTALVVGLRENAWQVERIYKGKKWPTWEMTRDGSRSMITHAWVRSKAWSWGRVLMSDAGRGHG
jgi:hypothetical protein